MVTVPVELCKRQFTAFCDLPVRQINSGRKIVIQLDMAAGLNRVTLVTLMTFLTLTLRVCLAEQHDLDLARNSSSPGYSGGKLKRKARPKMFERETVFETRYGNVTWPRREQVIVIEGNVTVGGLMMVHERDERMICGKIMPQGGMQATEAMLFTIDHINRLGLIPGVRLGARIKDDCDRDIYGLEQSVDFIRGISIKLSV